MVNLFVHAFIRHAKSFDYYCLIVCGSLMWFRLLAASMGKKKVEKRKKSEKQDFPNGGVAGRRAPVSGANK